ncbi:DUF6319 family protein [Nocardia donostiensis]|uniref:Cell wall anchor protein n=1 Tax=Nocardia donostiensis TaxID=1538463 RepID=A0A1V2TFE3_9NOCA|nr:DUF6319 family protein [Nocardia donostiensis]ONM48226.1 hypothetical protein B0T46_14090 [Nocardia donostiensis]OQS13980.1 hypothetical protein B0T36_17295 [Nocardia donostiensis]OQS20410.1 hypothetical protein B0T44_10745 [Nocardia donostiensis]
MSSPRTKPKPLSEQEIQQIAAEITEGRPPMVWFTAAAVGVPEGRSGKVVALGDPADGDFLQVRPTGSKDVLSFSPTEITLTKPPRDRAAAPAKQPTSKENSVPQPPSAPSPVSDAPTGSAPRTPAKTAPASTAGTAKPAAPKPAAPATPAAGKPAKSTAPRKAKTPEVTVTLVGTADGEWTVDVASGKKRTVRALPVASSAVAQAAKLLHPEVADVVAGVLEAARDAQQAKVEQLQAELEQAKRLLEDLSD